MPFTSEQVPGARDLRDVEHHRCCDALADVPADASTLCAGWTAHDLAAHLWALKQRDPRWWVGPTGRSRARALRHEVPYPDLVARLRESRPGFACMPDDRLTGHLHSLGEYFVHGEDVARPNGVDRGPVSDELADALWRRAGQAARILHRRTRGLILQRPDGTAQQPTKGSPTLVVTCDPAEVILWVYGRDGARVRVTSV